MKKIVIIFMLITIISAFPVYSGKVDKIVKKTVKGQWQEALELCDKSIDKLENSYLDVKDTLKPKKQRKRADVFIFVKLMKGFLELKSGNFSGSEMNFRKILIFYDSSSINQYLFKAYANLFLSKLMARSSNSTMKDKYLSDANNSISKYRALASEKEEKYEKILIGIMGSID